ncbi:Ferrous-iron efflux pump FieF [Lacunisphaera limnophila]|uniref:Ferrous-iron efflux pump FieF n=1 Tax=Lacunisphaera limnophila TaxID=1838286 RepID=A0A1D8ASD8_9BACT|nr:cation diffusion facilitator family transporter [Lacunisphaera limnophila]AOS43814.1 Ferrous-iron efflux pump FieF [Lacunisphaera limnophila]
MVLPETHARTARRAHESARLVLRGIVLNAVLAAVKLAGGVFGHTYALIADAAESLLDILSSLLVWAGFQVAARPPDEDHPYGHGKAESLSGLMVAAFIFLMAGWVAWHAVREINTPHQGPAWWTLLVLAAVIAAKLWFSRRMGAAGEEVGSTALGIEALHHWSDAMTSAAAFIGISIAIWGGPGWETADDWAALFACVIIAFNGLGMLKKALGDVMDTAAPENFEREVRALALAVPGVAALDKVRVRKSGLSHLVDIQVRVDGGLSVREGHAIAHAVKDALTASGTHAISDVTVHVEPDQQT